MRYSVLFLACAALGLMGSATARAQTATSEAKARQDEEALINTMGTVHYGTGNMPCHGWLYTRVDRGESAGPSHAMMFGVQMWIIGYIGAVRDISGKAQPDPKSVYAWIDRYCIDRQDDRISEATRAYILDPSH